MTPAALDLVSMFAEGRIPIPGLTGVDWTGSLIGAVISSILMGIPLMEMAKRKGLSNGWMGFIPILNLILMAQIAEKPLWTLLLFLVPCVNVIVMIWYWMAIAERFDKPAWLGILMWIPCINIIIPFYIAYSK